MVALVLLSIVVQLCIVYYYVIFQYFDNSRIKKFIKKIPGPFVWPIVGSLPALNVSPGKRKIFFLLPMTINLSYKPFFCFFSSRKTVEACKKVGSKVLSGL